MSTFSVVFSSVRFCQGKNTVSPGSQKLRFGWAILKRNCLKTLCWSHGFFKTSSINLFLQAADAPEEPAPLPVKSSDRLETDQKNQISFHQVALVYSMSQTHSNIEVCWYLWHRSRSHLVSTGWSILRSSVLGLDFLIANGKCGMAQWSLGVALGLLYPIGSSGRCSKTFKPRRGHNQRNGRTLVFWIATICTRRIP